MRRLVSSLVIVLTQALLAGRVSAQLSAQDIDALQQRGEQEGDEKTSYYRHIVFLILLGVRLLCPGSLNPG